MQVDRWVVQHDERRSCGGERLVQESQRVLGELAVVDPLASAASTSEFRATSRWSPTSVTDSAGPSVLDEAGAHVVVAGAGDERDRDGRQQLGGNLVLDIEPVVGHVSAQQQDVRRRRAGGDVVEGAAQPCGRFVGGPHVAIAQVGDDEPCHAGERIETAADHEGAQRIGRKRSINCG